LVDRATGRRWFEDVLLPAVASVSMLALLATLVLIFAFQAENITTKTLDVGLIAVQILIQVYFNSSRTYGLMRFFRVEYAIAAPGALIGESNFFELAVATAIALFRTGIWRCVCHSRRRADRGSGDVGLQRLQSNAALASCAGRGAMTGMRGPVMRVIVFRTVPPLIIGTCGVVPSRDFEAELIGARN
jgi:hypothetical protein